MNATIINQLLPGFQLVGFASLAFALAFVLHVAVWRMSAETPSGLVLIVLMSGAVLLEFLGAVMAAAEGYVAVSVPAIILVGALALQMAACYVISYPAMQANSPSLQIARQLADAGAEGLTREQLYRRLAEASLVRDRIEDLLKDHLAVEEDGRLWCTRRGAALARLFASWKALLGETKGG